MSRRSLNKELASEKVEIQFYLVSLKDGKKLLKPLKFTTKISLGLVRAISADTVIPTFYDTLSDNLRERGVKDGSTVQLRAKFSPGHEMFDPSLKGTKVICEAKV